MLFCTMRPAGVKSGYAAFDGSTLALTPAGLIVQNSILAELL